MCAHRTVRCAPRALGKSRRSGGARAALGARSARPPRRRRPPRQQAREPIGTALAIGRGMDLLNTAEIARAVGVTSETIRRYVREGRLVPAGRLPGGQLRFRPEQANELLASPAPGPRLAAQDVEVHVEAALAKVRIAARRRRAEG